MMKPVYITSASAISPQQHYEDAGFLDEVRNYEHGKLTIKEPAYKRYINPVAIRRMSKLLKMGISTGMNAIEQAGIQKPDAIIAGTGRGSMVDTEQFLLDMIRLEEEALTPTSFIQSTYNSVNGWLALQTKSNGYNQTYVNRGTSFELSLFDAQMYLNETTDRQYVLAGCFDEVTDDYISVKHKIGYWKQPAPPSVNLFNHTDTPGTIAGEGAAFFTLSNQKEGAICSLLGLAMLQDANDAEVGEAINQLLVNNSLNLEDIDIILCGMNGDSRQQSAYTQLINNTTARTTTGVFKHLCGEYDTSSGFALWLATKIFSTQSIPGTVIYKQGNHGPIKNILIVNHYILNSTSLILLQQ